MRDQGYSATNLGRIWERRTQAGEDLTHLFPDVAAARKSLRKFRSKSRTWLQESTQYPQLHMSMSKAIDNKLRELRRAERAAIIEALANLEVEIDGIIHRSELDLSLKECPPLNGKVVYGFNDTSPSAYFILRQAEVNIRKEFQLQGGSRQLMTEQAYRTLNGPEPVMGIKGDLKSFFESIPHDKLREEVNSRQHLSTTTKWLVSQVLDEFSLLTGRSSGLPRGISLSSTLAEIYALRFESLLPSPAGLLLRKRYVDDFLIIWALGDESSQTDPMNEIRSAAERCGLEINLAKTCKFARPGKSNKYNSLANSFFFLGYEFSLTDSGCVLDLSQDKLDRYKQRLRLSFDACRAGLNSPRAQAQLVERVRYLTGNTKLVNNKRHARVGLYYSNGLISGSTPRLTLLDQELRDLTTVAALSEITTESLNAMSFMDSLEQKLHRSVSPRRMGYIVSPWRNHA